MIESTFQPFPKIARLSRDCVVTEKIDGTNAQILIVESTPVDGDTTPYLGNFEVNGAFRWIAAGSRNRWLVLGDDNYGFAKWVYENAEQLVHLGPGRHFGEWWGAGIQRRYGLTEKRFSLFNVDRWGSAVLRPSCCSVVPIIYQGEFDTDNIQWELDGLRANGSVAAPGFMDPEGIVIWHEAARVMFKKTIKDDESPKTFVGSIAPTQKQMAGDAVLAASHVFTEKLQ